jgi:hypothetical protein
MTDSTENTTPQIPEDDHIILDGPVTPAVQESSTLGVGISHRLC